MHIETITPDRVPAYAAGVMDIIHQAGGKAWIVGGWVRDSLLDKNPKDIDICSSFHWQDIQEIFEDKGYEVIPTGIKHGTVTVIADHHPIEITTFRQETGYSDCRHPDQVVFVDKVEDDLARRDFTINAMVYNPRSGLLDLFGGVEDLKAGVIRAVGDAQVRFSEDALRQLRALRFACRLGFTLDEACAEAIHQLAPLLERVAWERIGQELSAIVATGRMGDVLEAFPDLMCFAIPELRDIYQLEQLSIYHNHDVYEHTVQVLKGAAIYAAGAPDAQALHWAALLHDLGKGGTRTIDEEGRGHFYGYQELSDCLAKTIMGRMALPKDLIADVRALILVHDAPLADRRKSQVKFLRKLEALRPGRAESLCFMALCLMQADSYGKAVPYRGRSVALSVQAEHFRELIAEEGIPLSPAQLKVGGRDVMEVFGLAAGPRIGELLQELLGAVIAGDVENQRSEQLQWLERKSQRMGCRRSG